MFARYFAMGALLGGLALQSHAAQALTLWECSAKYKAAKEAGTLNGMKWNDFQKTQCRATAAAAPGPAASPPGTTAKPAAAPASSPAVVGNAVFPSAVSSKYSGQSAAKARFHTCLDQYKANTTNNANGALKWIEKGGGYYSECNKRLKDAV
jgi:hypothetical protein